MAKQIETVDNSLQKIVTADSPTHLIDRNKYLYENQIISAFCTNHIVSESIVHEKHYQK